MLEIAVDNCVISIYVAENLRDVKQKEDKEAFEEMISLAEQGVIELGGPFPTLMIENLMKSGESRTKAQKLKGIIKYWPVYDPEPKKTKKQITCLHKIIQDPEETDSRQLVLISKCTQARYFVTVDYRFCRQFNHRQKEIINQCGINISVMRPLDFMRNYRAGKI